jgi:hypothetical protein
MLEMARDRPSARVPRPSSLSVFHPKQHPLLRLTPARSRGGTHRDRTATMSWHDTRWTIMPPPKPLQNPPYMQTAVMELARDWPLAHVSVRSGFHKHHLECTERRRRQPERATPARVLHSWLTADTLSGRRNGMDVAPDAPSRPASIEQSPPAPTTCTHHLHPPLGPPTTPLPQSGASSIGLFGWRKLRDGE